MNNEYSGWIVTPVSSTSTGESYPGITISTWKFTTLFGDLKWRRRSPFTWKKLVTMLFWILVPCDSEVRMLVIEWLAKNVYSYCVHWFYLSNWGEWPIGKTVMYELWLIDIKLNHLAYTTTTNIMVDLRRKLLTDWLTDCDSLLSSRRQQLPQFCWAGACGTDNARQSLTSQYVT